MAKYWFSFIKGQKRWLKSKFAFDSVYQRYLSCQLLILEIRETSVKTKQNSI